MPLNVDGYGKIIGESIEGAYRLYEAMRKLESFMAGKMTVRLIPLIQPDLTAPYTPDCKMMPLMGDNYMEQLDKAARKIADGYLHLPIRSKEVLPTPQQVNFGAQIDVLVAEIIRAHS